MNSWHCCEIDSDKKSINRSLNVLFYVCSQQGDISQQQQQNKQQNLYNLYKLTHRTMNNWFNNRNYQISIIQISLTLLAVAKCALYERCTIAMLKHVCDVFKHGQTAVAKSSLYERCTIAILKHVCDVLRQVQTAGAKSALYERCTIAILKHVCHILKQGQASLRWMSHSSVVLLVVLASSSS